ncbi:MAG: hypothetical protein L0Y66_04515 [Myxococcaceae bacterium]|nr:hypothetical protein [Myxococcaceae bacterium]
MRRLLLLVPLLLVPATALAQSAPEPLLQQLVHARSLGMGGAYFSQGLSADAVSGNPAALGLFRSYRVELSGAWDTVTKAGVASTSVVDGVTSSVAAGYAYHYASTGRGVDRRVSHLNALGLSIPLGSSVFLGASGRHVLETANGRPSGLTANAGLLVRMGEAFHVGVSGHNLVDFGHTDFPRFYVGSLGFVSGVVSAAVDLRAQPGRAVSPYSVAAGAEFIAGQLFPLRAGWSMDMDTGVHAVSGGLGVMVQGGGVDVGYRHELGGLGGRTLAVTLRMQMQ